MLYGDDDVDDDDDDDEYHPWIDRAVDSKNRIYNTILGYDILPRTHKVNATPVITVP